MSSSYKESNKIHLLANTQNQTYNWANAYFRKGRMARDYTKANLGKDSKAHKYLNKSHKEKSHIYTSTSQVLETPFTIYLAYAWPEVHNVLQMHYLFFSFCI